MKVTIIYIGVFFSSLLFPNTSEEQYIKANQLYAQGHYREALQEYMELEKAGIENADIYYNIANTYYRLSENGRAIQYYRKALKLKPEDGDIKSNLKYVRETVLDKVEESTTKSILAILFFWYYIFGERTLLILTLIFSSLMWLLLIIRLYKNKELLNWGLYIVVILFLCLGVSAMVKHIKQQSIKEGVVLVEEVPIRSSTSEDGVILFKLHEGVEFLIVDQLEDYYKIRLQDNKTGWIRKDFVGTI